MRVITWNCQMAFRKKWPHLLDLGPDIAVVPECESLEKFNFNSWPNHPTGTVWIGDNQHKGLGVFSFNDISLSLMPNYDPDYKHVCPLEVQGVKNITHMIAIWAKTNKYMSHIGTVKFGIKKYASLLDKGPLIIGDWNSNKIWDNDKNEGFSEVALSLDNAGFLNAYHHFFNENYGEESKPTLFFRRNKNETYHIDYCFAPIAICRHIHAVEIGKAQDWLPHSDHVPLIVDFNFDEV